MLLIQIQILLSLQYGYALKTVTLLVAMASWRY